MNFTCADCKGSFKWKLIADTSTSYISGTASTRIKGIRRYCAECHAANEWKREQAMRQSVVDMLASLPDDVREAYLARKADRS